MKTLGQRLRAARRRLKLTQSGAARIIGCDPVTLSKWENGREPRPGLYRERLMEFLKGAEESYR